VGDQTVNSGLWEFSLTSSFILKSTMILPLTLSFPIPTMTGEDDQ
jgi:hypothetical protein